MPLFLEGLYFSPLLKMGTIIPFAHTTGNLPGDSDPKSYWSLLEKLI
jgi:hypothetical protein